MCYYRVLSAALLPCAESRVTSVYVCHKLRYLLVTVRHFLVAKLAPLPCEISDISSYNQSSSTVLRTNQNTNNRRLFVKVFEGSDCNMLVCSFFLCLFIAAGTTGKRTSGSTDSTTITRLNDEFFSTKVACESTFLSIYAV